MPGPIFVSFEGGEGSGKTTQAQILVEQLKAEDIPVIMVREPGTTPLGQHLREFLKSKEPLSREAELLLFESARAELVATKILPSLNSGISIIADRFEASSIAYQGYGRGIPIGIIKELNSFATKGRYPDITFLLDIIPEDSAQRYGMQLSMPFDSSYGPTPSSRQEIPGERRFEDQPLRFHAKIRRGYLDLASENPERWVVIDATRSIKEISQEIWRYVEGRLKLASIK